MMLQGRKSVRLTWSALLLTVASAHAGNMGEATPTSFYKNIQFSAAGGVN